MSRQAMTIYHISGGYPEAGKLTKTGNSQENPHEQQQTLLLSRIIENVQKLNEAVMEMNQRLQAANIQTMDVELVAQMFKNYQSNVLFHLEATDNLKEPS
ncbi:DASH complex subunit DAD4 [Aspergillus foveolatus]|uniref:DASH complex subunit DAD4 n=1 Tax=Aspergillus foveolatus TaxID=210207 RepID=UPI003CCDD103